MDHLIPFTELFVHVDYIDIWRERCYHDGISSISIIYQMVSHDGKPYSNHRLQRINAPKSLFWLLATNSLFFADLINLYPLIYIRWMDDVEDDGTVFDPIIK